MMLYSDSTNAWGVVEGSSARPFGFNDFVYEGTASLRARKRAGIPPAFLPV